MPATVPLASITVPDPLLILLAGMATVLGLIIFLRTNAFLALIMAAIVVSLLAPGSVDLKIERVAAAFGTAAGKIGIVIALASVIGECMMASGAADRIVQAFLKLLGERRAPAALMLSGFVLAVPVFFDTVFYLLVPLARSLYKRTNANFVLYVMAICAGGAVTHTLVPPTPGPLGMAENLHLDLGTMILLGSLVGMPMALAGLWFSHVLNRRMPIPMRDLVVEAPYVAPEGARMPGLFWSMMPVVLPILLITGNTICMALAEARPDMISPEMVSWSKVLGNANLALLLSLVIAVAVLVITRRPDKLSVAKLVDVSLTSGGMMILITAAGGAFGAMLSEARIKDLFPTSQEGDGMFMLLLGFGVAAVFKVAQGSSTVAMLTTSGMLATVATAEQLGFHPVYLATAIGSGSLIGSWMNDSGFWIVAKMSGLTELEALRSWTLLLLVLGSTGLIMTLILANVMPLV